MCGRFTLGAPPDAMLQYFDISANGIEFQPRYNIAPSQNVLTISSRRGDPHASLMRWGLVPFWAKDVKIGYKMINARAETVAERNSYKSAFQNRRCLIPSDSFYEWKGEGKNKQPIRIMLKSEKPFAFAGIWETWKDKENPDGEPIHSCSIITTVPNSLTETIHDRMPVILPEELYKDWIDPTNHDTGRLREMLLPYDPGLMKAYQVSTLVNSPKNYGPELIAPVGS